MTTPEHSPLGKATAYADRYDPSLLFPIPRASKRAELGIVGALPFHGVDIWNAYELSWLDAGGKPRVALAEIRVPARSPSIIESKSFKLYLNSFSQERIADGALRETVERDLSVAAGAPVTVEFIAPIAQSQDVGDLEGESLDRQALAIDDYGPPNADYLSACGDGVVEETLVSDLLRSNCPVTGQPDWGSVQIRYRGRPIDRAGLLRYIVSFRTHSGFHEQCVEQIYLDLTARCAPEHLSVYARYTRRGGLDINPFRSSRPGGMPANLRGARQ